VLFRSSEWERARRLNPRIHVLHRNLGRTWLAIKKDERRAIEVFREGLSTDPTNVELYAGMSAAQGILRRPAAERLKVLESYPDQKNLPTPLMFDTALSLAEMGQYERARKLFYNHYFEREEHGINVRQAFLEVQLLQALALAAEGKHEEARSAMSDFGKKVENLPFTSSGMEPFIAEARFQFYLGQVELLLGERGAAEGHWRKAAAGAGAFAVLAAQRLGEANWKKKAAEVIADRGEPSINPVRLYQRGLILRALGKEEEGTASLEDCLRQSDAQMAHYLARRALAGLDYTLAGRGSGHSTAQRRFTP
jgi:tetratricopeptide (TPR) repeat protein